MMLLVLLTLFFQNSFAILPPEDIKLPGKISSMNSAQIQSAFQKLRDKHENDRGALWWLQFREGEMLKKKSPELFCNNMEALSKETEFPLNSLAEIYFYENCSLEEPLFFRMEDFSDWLKGLAALAPYRRGKKTGNQKEILDAAIYLGIYSRSKELKVSYQRHAQHLAKELKDSRLKTIEQRLFQIAPRFRPHPQIRDSLPMAHDFRKVRNFKKAAFYYVRVLNSNETSWREKNQAFKWMAWIHKSQNNKKKLLEISRQWSAWLFSEKNQKAWRAFYKNQLKIARRYWNLDQNQEALNLLDSILKEPESALIREEVHWLKGLIKMEKGFFEKSLKEFDLALKEIKKNKGSTSLQEKILWKKAWALRESQKLKASIQTLKKLKNITSNPYTKARASFWMGENQRDLNRLFYSSKIFRSLRTEDPVGYYGLMACYRLQKEPLISIGNIQLPLEKVELTTKDFHLAFWLMSLKKTELLERFLKSQKESLENKTRETLEDWISLLSLYQITGQYLNIFQAFALMPSPLQKLFAKDYGSLLFPLAFQEEIRKEAIKQKISPAMLFALIRQESAFNRKARSPSDAFGLMQLIPSTAREMAKKIRQPFRGYRDLYNVKTNIHLGTRYFKNLLSRYEGSFILAAAAYNAGGTPVKKWQSVLDTTRPLDFIENIPYEETRTYVRLLIRNFIIYNKILKDLYKTDQNEMTFLPLTAQAKKDKDGLSNEKQDRKTFFKWPFSTDSNSKENSKEKTSSDFPEWLFHI